jgi:predicted transcriptional regulator
MHHKQNNKENKGFELTQEGIGVIKNSSRYL